MTDTSNAESRKPQSRPAGAAGIHGATRPQSPRGVPAIIVNTNAGIHGATRPQSPRGVPAIIVNTNAGGLRRDPGLLERIVAASGPRGLVLPTRTPADLAEATRVALSEQRPAIVLCGGDGSYCMGVTALLDAAGTRELPPLVLAPAGTVAIVARNWKSPRDVVSTIGRVCARPETLHVTARPTLSVVGDDGPARVGFTVGTGLVARFFDEYERTGAGGNSAAFRIALGVFVGSIAGGALAKRILSPLPCRLTVDGAELEPSAFSLVLCSVLRDVGLHLHVTHRAAEDPERPHLVASPLPPRALAVQWPRVVLGRRLAGAGNFDGLFERLVVEFPDQGPYVLDGDTFRAHRISVTAGPVLRIAT